MRNQSIQRRSRWFTLFVALVLPMFSLGCLQLDRASPAKRTFRLSAARNAEKVSGGFDVVLAVSPFRVAPTFEISKLVFRTEENEYELDYYHEFVVLPGEMITATIHGWLARSGVFANVVSPGSLVNAKYFLEGTVSDLYADVRDPEKPRAVVELHAYLTTSSAESPSRILFNRNYREVQVMTGPGPAEFVKSAGVALTNILEALEDDLLKLAREMDREQETRS